MNITKKVNTDNISLMLNGRLDTNTSPQFQDALMEAFNENKNIILDFSELVYVSSAGLRTLLMGQKTANAKSGSMIITNVSEDIAEVFNMTGFSKILTVK